MKWDDETIVPPPSARAENAAPSHEPADPIRDAQAATGRRYSITGIAGQGAMGRVFRAHDEILARHVAIKMLQASWRNESAEPETWTTEDRDRLIAEARAMAGLNHPNACRVLEVCIDPPHGAAPERFAPFIVMEWIDGAPLDETWRRLPIDERLEQFVSIVEAAAAIHGAGLVHQDIKPSNILVDRRGHPFIVDFGLARTGHRDGHVTGGTPGWAAPEQIRGVQGEQVTIDARADVFALGVILYDLLTDQRPFDAPTIPAVFERTLRGMPQLPEELNPSAPAALQRICLQAIDPSPERRYRDAGAMLADLRRHASGETVTARPALLMGRFAEQVEGVVEQVGRWAHQEMIAADEARLMKARLADLQRPESPWILDSRRLSGPQVTLYLGGWMIFLSLTIGIWHAHDSLVRSWPALAWGLPLLTAGTVLALGFLMHAAGHRRASLAFFVTASLCLPAAAWQCVRSRSLLAVPAESEAEQAAQLFGPLFADQTGSLGLQNLQLAAILSIGLVGAIVFRIFSRSSAFSLVSCLFLVPWWTTIWLTAGRLHGWEQRTVAAELGAWLLALSLVMLASGMLLNRREESLLADLGRSRFRTADAWPLVSLGAITMVGSLSLIAACVPELLLLRPLPPLEEGASFIRPPNPDVRAGAFLVVGLLLLACSWLLSLRPTSLLDRTVRGMRWIIPTYILFPVAWLEFHDAAPGWALWFVLLALASLGAVFASAAQQWKPFLLTGLLYLSEWYVRAFDRLRTDESPRDLLLLLGMGAVGMLTMLAAWSTMRRRPYRALQTDVDA